jgi:hypothetical protein
MAVRNVSASFRIALCRLYDLVAGVVELDRSTPSSASWPGGLQQGGSRVLELLHSINIHRAKERIHEVNRLPQDPSERRSSTPFDAYVKKAQQGGQ